MTGPLVGSPPSGKPGVVTGTSIRRFANGTWIEDHITLNTLGMLQQIGVIPRMG